MTRINLSKFDDVGFRINEEIKVLRSNLEFCGDDKKVITVTSCIPNEGKSSIVILLAKSFAESGKKVLLIDGDMRKSIMLQRVGVEGATKGLSHWLSGQVDLKETILPTSTPNMYMVLSGPTPPNPAELLSNSRFQMMITAARKVYDVVLIDTPPLGSVIDSAIIAKNSDGAVLVIASGAVSYHLAQNVVEQLKKTECPILGAVLNKFDIKAKGYYNKYYDKYYGDYYGNYYGNYNSEQE